MSTVLGTQIKKMSLQKGDILIIEKGFIDTRAAWAEALRDAGKQAGIDFSVPIVFVDSINSVAVVKLGQ